MRSAMKPMCTGPSPFMLLFILSVATAAAGQNAPTNHLPIIDVHLHALNVGDFSTGASAKPTEICASNENLVWSGWDPQKPFTVAGSGLSCKGARFPASRTNEELMRQTLAVLERYNIRAVTSGDLEQVSKWRAAAPDRIIPAADFRRPGHDVQGKPLLRGPEELRRLVTDRKIAVFAEVGPQYDGMSPADPALEPYFALAEELDVPVGLHMGEGPPGGRNVEGYSAYRVRIGGRDARASPC
jgi:hypothetical protein